MPTPRMMIAQGGGPTAVINQSLVGAVITARDSLGWQVLGARFGVRGVVADDLVDLSARSDAELEAVAATPCAALGSTRDKPDGDYCDRILDALRGHGVEAFLYVGGNDSSATLALIAERARACGYPLQCVHVPKTIDNDLVANDHTPGFPSAARFVANAFAGIDLDVHAMPAIYVGIVMGRHAGFLTAAATQWRRSADDGPHLVYLPERPFEPERFVADVAAVQARLGRCVVAVSEGVSDAAGRPVAEALAEANGTAIERDAHGNVQLSGSALAAALADLLKGRVHARRVRVDTFGFLQRAYPDCIAETDRAEARAVGAVAARTGQDRSGSVTIRRIADYAVDYPVVALEEVAGRTRTVPDAFIADNQADVTPAFHRYLAPLVGPETQRHRPFL